MPFNSHVQSRTMHALASALWIGLAVCSQACGSKVLGSLPAQTGAPPSMNVPTPGTGGVTAVGTGGRGSFGGAAGAASGTPNPPIFDADVTAADPPPSISGGTLLVLHDGLTAVASDPDRDEVWIANLSTLALLPSVLLNSHDEPGRLVEDAAGHVHVVLRRGGALVSIDPQTATILARRSVCAIPRGVAYDPVTDLVHVACMGGELVSLPAAGGTATRTLQLQRDLRDVVVDGNTLLVSQFRIADVLVVDANGTVTSTAAPPPYSESSVRNGATFTPSTAWRMRPAPGGGAVMLHQRGTTDTVMVGMSTGGYGSSNPCGGLIHPALTPIGGGAQAVATPPIIGMVLPVDFALSSDGTTVAIVAAGNAHNSGLPTVFVARFADVTDGSFLGCCSDGIHAPTIPGLQVQRGCFGDSLSPDAGAASSQPSGEVEAVAFDGSDRVVVQTREPATLQIPSVGLTIALSATSRADAGHEVFHANTGIGIACASCHAEGQEDGRIWTFDDEGARRTMSVAGGIGGRTPYHWSGDVPDFNTLVSTVYHGRMGGPLLSATLVSATQAWIDAIPSLPGVVSDPAAIARGQTLFDDNANHGCAVCHNGPELTTTGRTVDVGTGGIFKVPSLVGLAWTAPYLHDGCAATLADRFGSCGGGDKHGVTSTLTSSQLSDLITYLDSL